MFAELRSGLVALLINSRRHIDPIGVLYSPASRRVQWLLDRKTTGEDWSQRDASAEYQDDATRAATRDFGRLVEHRGLQHRFLSSVDITRGELRSGALKLPSILMQGITHIAPAVGIVLTIQLISSLAGVTAPLAYLIAFAIVLTLGISLTQLAKHLASAGGYYTYVSRTVSPGAGFITAWLYFLYDPTAAAINLAFMGFFFESTMKAEYGIFFPWWCFFLLGVLLITLLVHFGVEISAGTMVLLGIAEIAIVVGLSVTGLLRPGVPRRSPCWAHRAVAARCSRSRRSP